MSLHLNKYERSVLYSTR